MIISKNLILNFFPEIGKFSIEKLSDAFFRSGIELEKYEQIEKPSGLFYGLVESVEEIPNAKKKISKCQVFIPQKKETIQIVCGAQNVRKNLKVLVALPGAKILNGEKLIEKVKIYEVFSEGMICGFYELYKSELLDNFDKEIPEIIELPENWNIEKEVDFQDICLDDVIFFLSIPANRKDLNCAWGLAQELKKNLGIFSSQEENFEFKFSNSIFFLRQMLQNNNFFARNDFLELLQIYVFASFGQAFSIDKNSNRKYDFKFEDKSQIYKNSLITRENFSYFKKLTYDFLSKNLDLSPLSESDHKKIYANKKKSIFLNWTKISKFFNISPLDKEKIINILSNSGFEFSENNEYCLIPYWREDIKNQDDFLSEISSIFSLKSIAEEKLPFFYSEKIKNSEILNIEKTKFFWLNKNFFECNTFSLQKEANVKKNDIFSIKKFVKVKSPLSSDHQIFRTNALNELKNVIEKNEKHKNQLFPVFEIFESNNWDEKAENIEKHWTLNLVVPELKNIYFLGKEIFSYDLYDLQALLRRNASFFNQKIKFKKSENNSQTFFYKKNLLEIYDSSEKFIGFLGILQSKLQFNLYGAVMKLEFFTSKDKFIPEYSNFPPSYKDISIDITNSKYSVGEILNLLKNTNALFLKDLNLIDSYVDKNFSSITLSAKFQSFDKTLTSDDIKKNIDILYKKIEEINLKVR